MIAGARYGHTNLIANDWRALSRFYQELFGCIPVPPVRDFKGSDLERGTGIPGAELRGELHRMALFNFNFVFGQGRGPDRVRRGIRTTTT